MTRMSSRASGNTRTTGASSGSGRRRTKTDQPARPSSIRKAKTFGSKAFSVLMSVVLAVSMMPLPAYAGDLAAANVEYNGSLLSKTTAKISEASLQIASDSGSASYTTVGQYTYVLADSGYYYLTVRGGNGAAGFIKKNSNAGSGNDKAGGSGGSAKGYVYLDKSTVPTLYLYVGGNGNQKYGGANGGGTGASNTQGRDAYELSQGYGGGGGGASHVATAPGTLSQIYSNSSNNATTYKSKLLLVAGGGGGSSGLHYIKRKADPIVTGAGGAGGSDGGDGAKGDDATYSSSKYAYGGSGGSQTSGGAYGAASGFNYTNRGNPTNGEAGQGGQSSDTEWVETAEAYGGAGGGGLYGGGCAGHAVDDYGEGGSVALAGGGGGSGYKASEVTTPSNSSAPTALSTSSVTVSDVTIRYYDPYGNVIYRGNHAEDHTVLNSSGGTSSINEDGHWSVSASGNTADYQAGTTIQASYEPLDLYQSYYTVTYDSNSGSWSGESPSDKKVWDTDLTLTSEHPRKDGYRFMGWSLDQNAITAQFSPDETVANTDLGKTASFNADPVTLFAVWAKAPQAASYYTDAGQQKYDLEDSGFYYFTARGGDGASGVIQSSSSATQNSAAAGLGGSVRGYTYIDKAAIPTLYLYIGGNGNKNVGGVNGGGTAAIEGSGYGGGGGGASHIATAQGTLAQIYSNSSRNDTNYKSKLLLVAGGGGGSGGVGYHQSYTSTYNMGVGGDGGSDGGNGVAGGKAEYSSSIYAAGGGGGTQSAGGTAGSVTGSIGYTNTSRSDLAVLGGSAGQGAGTSASAPASANPKWASTQEPYSGGGGGGLYGGGGGGLGCNDRNSPTIIGGAGGGSGYKASSITTPMDALSPDPYAQSSVSVTDITIRYRDVDGNVQYRANRALGNTTLSYNDALGSGESIGYWSTKSDGSTIDYTVGDSIPASYDGPLDLYKCYYSINYDVGDGSWTGAAPITKKVWGTDATITTQKPQREGYRFLGWAFSADSTNADLNSGQEGVTDEQFGKTTPDFTSVTLHAVWQEIPYASYYYKESGQHTYDLEDSGYYYLTVRGGDGAAGIVRRASGTQASANGGIGGSARGYVYIDKDVIPTLYLYVGGNANGANGGANGGADAPNQGSGNGRGGGGGGASHVATVAGTLSQIYSNSSANDATYKSKLLLVAGGGGGSGGLGYNQADVVGSAVGAGGDGGSDGGNGMKGEGATYKYSNVDYYATGGGGGTQSSGGAVGTSYDTPYNQNYDALQASAGAAGQGGTSKNPGWYSTPEPYSGGAGGGLYGGGGAGFLAIDSNAGPAVLAGAGGGSGYKAADITTPLNDPIAPLAYDTSAVSVTDITIRYYDVDGNVKYRANRSLGHMVLSYSAVLGFGGDVGYWSTDAEMGSIEYGPGDNIPASYDGPLSLHQCYYPVSYAANNGSWSAGAPSTKKPWGVDTEVASDQPIRTGYSFKGWALTPDASSASIGAGQIVTDSDLGKAQFSAGEVVLYAVWEPNPYELTLDNQGATTAGTAKVCYTFDTASYFSDTAHSTAITAIEVPAKTGYDFGGYYTAQNGGGTQYIDATGNLMNDPYNSVYADTVLYAKWVPHAYKVAFHSNGGSGGMADQDFTYGAPQNLTANAFTREGYTFAGWRTQASGGDSYSDKQEVSNLTAESNGVFDLYAQWSKNTYTVTFKTGDKTMGTQPFTYDEAQNLTAVDADTLVLSGSSVSAPVAKDKGWEFVGWAKNPNVTDESQLLGNGASVSNLTAEPDGAVTLYAVYKRNVSFTYYPNDMSVDTVEDTTRVQYYRNTDIDKASAGSVSAFPLYKQKDRNWTPVGWATASDTRSVDPDNKQTGSAAISVTPLPASAATYYAVYQRSVEPTYRSNTTPEETRPSAVILQYFNAGKSESFEATFNAPGSNAFTNGGSNLIGWDESPAAIEPTYKVGQQACIIPSTHTAWDSPYTIDLYAIWEAKEYTVKFVSGSTELGTQGIPVDKDTDLARVYDDGDLLKVTGFDDAAPVRVSNGWTFAGWAAAPGTTAVKYANGGKVTVVDPLAGADEEVTLYAVYKRYIPFKYYNASDQLVTTPSADVSGSVPSDGRVQYYYNTAADSADATNVTSPALVASAAYGWAPLGWVNCTADDIAGGTDPSKAVGQNFTVATEFKPAVDTPATYFARYSRMAGFTYDGYFPTSGSVADTIEPQYFNAGANAAEKLDVTTRANGYQKTGYVFKGWCNYTPPSAKTHEVTTAYTLSNTQWDSAPLTTLNAFWEATNHKVYATGTNVTISNSGATFNSPTEFTFGNLVILAAEAANGYTITGSEWTVTEDGGTGKPDIVVNTPTVLVFRMPAYDVRVTAPEATQNALTVIAEGATVTVNGENVASGGTFPLQGKTSLAIVATAAKGYRFDASTSQLDLNGTKYSGTVSADETTFTVTGLPVPASSATATVTALPKSYKVTPALASGKNIKSVGTPVSEIDSKKLGVGDTVRISDISAGTEANEGYGNITWELTYEDGGSYAWVVDGSTGSWVLNGTPTQLGNDARFAMPAADVIATPSATVQSYKVTAAAGTGVRTAALASGQHADTVAYSDSVNANSATASEYLPGYSATGGLTYKAYKTGTSQYLSSTGTWDATEATAANLTTFTMPAADVTIVVSAAPDAYNVHLYGLTHGTTGEDFEFVGAGNATTTVSDVPQTRNYEGKYSVDTTTPVKVGPAAHEGYTFVGWSGMGLDGNLSQTFEYSYDTGLGLAKIVGYDKNNVKIEEGYVLLKNLAFTANWEINKYNVTFTDESGDSTLAGMPFAQVVPYKSVASEPPAPTRTGYAFDKWCTRTGSAGSYTYAPYAFTTPVTADITLYATWKVQEYPIVLDLGGGSLTTSGNLADSWTVSSGIATSVNGKTSYTVAKQITLPQPSGTDVTVSKDGHAFDGWYTDTAFTAPAVTTVGGDTTTTGPVRLYAKWTIDTSELTVPLLQHATVYVNGEPITSQIEESGVPFGTTYTVRVVPDAGYQLQGSLKAYDGAETAISGTTPDPVTLVFTMPTSDVTVAMPTVVENTYTLEADTTTAADNKVDPSTVKFYNASTQEITTSAVGATVTPKTSAVSGTPAWVVYTEGEGGAKHFIGTDPDTGAFTMPAGNVKAYAVSSATCTVVPVTGEGVDAATVKVDGADATIANAGQAVALSAPQLKDGYQFKQWVLKPASGTFASASELGTITGGTATYNATDGTIVVTGAADISFDMPNPARSITATAVAEKVTYAFTVSVTDDGNAQTTTVTAVGATLDAPVPVVGTNTTVTTYVGHAAAGDTVVLTATAGTGTTLASQWTAPAGVTPGGNAGGVLIFDMPAKAGKVASISSTATEYAVTFDKNTSDTVASMPAAQNVKHGTQATAPTAPTRTGYTFGGWYKGHATSAGQEWNFSSDTVTAPVTLYAKWTQSDYTLNVPLLANADVYVNGVLLTAAYSATHHYNDAVVVKVEPHVGYQYKAGQALTAKKADSSDLVTAPATAGSRSAVSISATMPESNVTVTMPEIEATSYTLNVDNTTSVANKVTDITFDSNAATGVASAVVGTPITPKTATTHNPIHWVAYTTDGTNKSYIATDPNTGAFAMPAGHVYVYAVNASVYTAVAVAGEGVKAAKVEVGADASSLTETPIVSGGNTVKLSVPTIESGYQFKQWVLKKASGTFASVNDLGVITADGTAIDMTDTTKVKLESGAIVVTGCPSISFTMPNDPVSIVATAQAEKADHAITVKVFDNNPLNGAKTTVTPTGATLTENSSSTSGTTTTTEYKASAKSGATVALKAVAPTGSTFTKGEQWTIDGVGAAGNAGGVLVFDVPADGSVTAIITSARDTHAVTFESNGGSTVEPAPVDYGNTVAKPADPTWTGRSFKGWFTDAALTSEYDFNTPVTTDLTLHAKWEEIGYTLNVPKMDNADVYVNGVKLEGPAYNNTSLHHGDAFVVKVVPHEGYKYTASQALTATKATASADATVAMQTATAGASDPVSISFTMPDDSVNVTLPAIDATPYSITAVAPTGISNVVKTDAITIKKDSETVSGANVGDKIALTTTVSQGIITWVAYTEKGTGADAVKTYIAIDPGAGTFTMPAADVHVYAVKGEVHTVTSTASEGVGSATVKVGGVDTPIAAAGNEVELTASNLGSGYEFEGWKLRKVGDTPFTSVNELGGIKDAGGTIIDSAKLSIDAAGNIVVPAEQSISFTMPSPAVSVLATAVAKRSPKTFTVTVTDEGDAKTTSLNATGATLVEPAAGATNPVVATADGKTTATYTYSTTYGETVTLSATAVEGTTLKGWALTGASELNKTDTTLIFDVPAGDFSAAIESAVNEYAVTFDSNGGSHVDPVNVKHNQKAAAPDPAPTYAGYKLDGWFKDHNLTNEWKFDADTVTEPVKLYAKWSQQDDRLRYDANPPAGVTPAGNTSPTVGKTFDSVRVADSFFRCPGYNFVGWNVAKDGSGAAYAVGTLFPLTPADDVLYAQWDENELTVEPMEDVVYNGQAQRVTPVVKGYDGTPLEAGKDYTVSYNPATPINAGKVTVTIDGIGADYGLAQNVEATYNIKPAPLTVTAVDKNVIYGADVPTYEATAEGLQGGDAIGSVGKVTFTCPYAKNNHTGTYTITPKIEETDAKTVANGGVFDNYDITFVDGTLTVGKAPLTVTANDASITYGDEVTNNGVRFKGFVADDDESKLGGLLGYAQVYKRGGDVGEYPIKATGYTSDDYEITFVDGKLTVSPREVSLNWASDLVYTGVEQTYDGATVADTVFGDVITVGGYTADTVLKGIDRRTYKAEVASLAGEKAKNYTLPADPSHDWRITGAENAWMVTPAMAGWTYGETASEPAGEARFGNNTLKFEYKARGAVDSTYRTERPTAAGQYVMRASVDGTDQYQGLKAEVEFTVAKAALTVEAKDATITYGDAPANNGVTYTGFVNGENENTAGVFGYSTLGYAYDYERYGDVGGGKFKIIPTGLAAPNYDIKFVEGTLTVNKKEVGLLWRDDLVYTGSELTYASVDPARGATVTGAVGSDKITVGAYVGTTAATDRGAYDVSVKELAGDKAANYLLPADPSHTWNIAQDANEWKTEPAIEGWTYGEAAKVPSGAAKYGKVAYEYKAKDASDSTFSAEPPKHAGDYVMRASVAGTADYTGLTKDVEFTVAKAQLTVTAKPKEITYGDAPANDGFEASGFVNGDDVSRLGGEAAYRYTYERYGDVGTYYIIPGGLESSDYDISYAYGALDVEQLPAEFTWTGDEFTFDGTAKTVTAKVSNAQNGDEIALAYENNQKTEAGDYTAKVTGLSGARSGNYKLDQSAATASHAWKIVKAANSVSVSLEGWTYGGEAKSPVATADYGVSTAKFSYSDAPDGTYTSTVPTKAGTHYVKATIAEKADYAGAESEPVAFEISKAKLTVTAKPHAITYGDAPANDGVTYAGLVDADRDGEAPKSGVVSGELAYQYGTAADPAAAGYKAYAAGSDTGAYFIIPGGLTSDNYDVEFAPGTLTVGKKTVGLSWAADMPYTGGVQYYAGAKPKADSLFEGDDVSVGSYGDSSVMSATEANTTGYPVTVTGLKGAKAHNYVLPTEVSHNWKITVPNNEWTTAPAIAGWTYGKAASTPAGAAKFGAVKFEYKAADADDSRYSTTVPTKAGNYKMRASVEGTDNYNALSKVVGFAIAKAEVTVTADDKVSKYGDPLQTLTWTISGDYVDGDDLAISASTDAATATVVGPYDIVVSSAGNDDYTVTPVKGTYTLTNADLKVDAKGYSGVYDGRAHSIAVSTEGSGGTPTITYCSTENGTYTENALEYKDAGTYTVYYKVHVDNYDDVAGSKQVVIEKAPLKVTAEDKTATYGDAAPAYTAKYEGFVNEETESVASAQVSFDCSYAQGSDAGSYAITPSGLEAANYDVTFAPGTLAVAKKEIGLVWAVDMPYNGGAQYYAGATVTGAVSGDDVSVGSYSAGSTMVATNVGEYPAEVTGLKGAKAQNYALPPVPSHTWKVIFSDNEWTTAPAIAGWNYGKTASTPVAVAKFGDVTFDYKVKGADDSTYISDVPTAAGDYTMRASVAADANYGALTGTADFKIEKAKITITADDKVSQHGKDPLPLTATVTGDLKSGDILNAGATTDPAVTSSTGVGTYPIVPTWTENSNYEVTLVNGTYTVISADLTVDAKGYNGVYDGKPHGISVELGSSSGTPDATVYYSESALDETNYSGAATESPTLTGAGSKTVFYYVHSDNFSGGPAVKGSKQVVIEKAPLTVTAKPKSITYGEAGMNDGVEYSGFVGTDNESSLGGTLTYLYATTATATASDYEAGSDAGAYYIIPGGLTSDNYDVTFVPGTLTVGKKEIGLDWAADMTYTGGVQYYDGASVTGAVDGDDVSVGSYSNESVMSATDVGEYSAEVTGLKGTKAQNYSLPNDAKHTWKISFPTNEWTTAPAIAGWTYGKTASTPAGAAMFGNVTFWYKAADADDSTYSTTVPTKAGNYKMRASVEGTDNYDALSKEVDFTIAKAEVTVTADDKVSKYGDPLQTLTWTISGDYVDGDDLAISASTDAATATAVGPYDIEVSSAGNDDYTVTPVKGTYTLTNADLKVDAKGYSGVYDGRAHSIAVSTEGSGGTPTITYCSTENGTYTENALEYKDAGTYTVYYKVHVDNYDDVAGSKQVVIEKAPLKVTAEDKGITYGDAAPAYAAKYEGFVNGETESVATAPVSFGCAYAQGSDAGSYAITPSGLAAANYDVTFVPGTLTVGKKEIGLGWAADMTYTGGVQHYPGATVEGAVSGDDVSVGTYSGTMSATSRGEYTAVATGLVGDAAANYALPSEASYNWKITRANNTASVTLEGWKYGEAAKTPVVTAPLGAAKAQFTYSDKIDGTFTSAVPTQAGTYYVKATIPETADYGAATSDPAEFTIAKAPLKVKANDNAITYGDEPAAAGVSYEGLVGADAGANGAPADGVVGGELAYDFNYERYGDAGDYAITPKGLTAANYDITFEPGKLAVGKYTIGLDWAADPAYSGGVQTYAGATVTGALNGDEVTVGSYEGTTSAEHADGTPHDVTATALSGAKAQNYALPTDDTVNHTWHIVKAENSWAETPSAQGWTYGDEPADPAAKPAYGKPLYQYKAKGADDLTYTTTVPTAAGDYEVRAIVPGTDDYTELVSPSAEFTIAKAVVTVSADNKGSLYGTDLQQLTFSVDGAYKRGDDLGVSLSTDARKGSPVGSYAIRATGGDNPNYSITLKNGTYTVSKAPMLVVSADYVGVYDGKAHGITVTTSPSGQGATVYYSTSTPLNASNYLRAGTTKAPTRTAVGTTTVYYYVAAANYAPQPASGSRAIRVTSAGLGGGGSDTVTVITGPGSASTALATAASNTIVPMYRLYNPNSGEHFYTASASERDLLKTIGWIDEGIGWHAPVWSKTPVYRLYNPASGDHHYTTSAAERDWLARDHGWRAEGVGWYSDDAKRVPLYRQFNPNAVVGTHNYTFSKAENDHLVSVGWRAEGIGWYGVRAQ